MHSLIVLAYMKVHVVKAIKKKQGGRGGDIEGRGACVGGGVVGGCC